MQTFKLIEWGLFRSIFKKFSFTQKRFFCCNLLTGVLFIRDIQEMATAEAKGRHREWQSIQSKSNSDTELQSTRSTSLESCEPRTADYLTHGGQERTQRNGQVCWQCFAGIGRPGGLMVSALDSGSSGPGSSAGHAGSLCCVLGQDTLLSRAQCLSPPRNINEYD